MFLWRASGTLVLGWCLVPRTALRLYGVTRISCLRHEGLQDGLRTPHCTAFVRGYWNFVPSARGDRDGSRAMCCAELVCGTPIARAVYGAGSSCTTCICGEGRCGYEEAAVRVSVMCCAELVCGTPIARAVYGAGSSCTTCICGEGRCGYEEAAVRVSVMCCAELVCGTPIARAVYGAGSSCTTCICGEGRCKREKAAVRVSVMCCAELVCGTPIARGVYGTGSSCTTCICGEGRCKHEKVAVAWGHVLRCVGLWSNERLCLRHDGKNVSATKLHLAC